MEDLNIQVIKGFGIKTRKIVKEKSTYICNIGNGYRMIRKSGDNCESIEFQHEIKEYLYNMGFTATDRFFISTQNKPYFTFDDTNYIMTDFLPYREAEFSQNNEFLKIVEKVSLFHSYLKTKDLTEYSICDFENTKESYLKKQSELKAVKKWINSQKRLLDFDVMFLKNYNYYQNCLTESLGLFDKTVFIQTEKTICHNHIKEENILVDSDQIYLTKFSEACVGCGLVDLAGLIRRYIKNKPEILLEFENILETYSLHNPLKQADIEMLHYLLLYPQRFINVCNQYYTKKRSFTPSAVISRMKEVIENQIIFDDFLSGYRKL